MKYTIALAAVLLGTWLFWSGHLDPFLLLLGASSVAGSLWVSHRMRIVDEEGAPAEFGIRLFTHYAPWLIKEIIISNLQVAKVILSPTMRLKRNLVQVTAHQHTAIGRVIHANSITLTPGTVSVNVEDDQIQVHALCYEGDEEEISGEMDERVTRLEPAIKREVNRS